MKKLIEKIVDATPYWIYKILNELRPTILRGTIKRFFQRRFRGWDDSELWNLDYSFYCWMLPRLKEFSKLTVAHPEGYTHESWIREIKINIGRLEKIIQDEKFESDEEVLLFMEWFSKNIHYLWW